MPKTVSIAPAADHSIVVHGHDRMSLLDEGNQHLVGARRIDGVWHISVDGIEDVTTTDVHEAILKMTEHAQLSRNGSLDVPGFSTWVPHEARKLDGPESHAAWRKKHGLAPESF